MKDSTYSDLVIFWFSQCKTHIFFTSFIWFTNVQNSMFLRGKEKQVWGGQRARYIFFFWQSQQRDKLPFKKKNREISLIWVPSTCVVPCNPYIFGEIRHRHRGQLVCMGIELCGLKDGKRLWWRLWVGVACGFLES